MLYPEKLVKNIYIGTIFWNCRREWFEIYCRQISDDKYLSSYSDGDDPDLVVTFDELWSYSKFCKTALLGGFYFHDEGADREPWRWRSIVEDALNSNIKND
jgi:hypothetical protein